MTDQPGPSDAAGHWLDNAAHRDWLAADARRQFDFFRAAVGEKDGFLNLALDGTPLPKQVQELFQTARHVHSYSLGHLWGIDGADAVVDHGMRFLWSHHRDREHGGYVWSLDGDAYVDDRKLAYGHVHVLLAGSSAKEAGHPDADRLIDDVSGVIDRHFWDEDKGLLREEYNRDWSPFSTYRGMNANMHGSEAMLAAFEATGREVYLDRAGRILGFFAAQMAPGNGWRIPEHYTGDWTVDRDYSENPMFRPPGTTPGHSFEVGRLALQWWDLAGRPDDGTPERARRIIEQALADGWDAARGGIVYTLDHDGKVAIPARYWWPVTEAIGAMATLIKLDRRAEDEAWYRRLWDFADRHFIDHERGGWYHELNAEGRDTEVQFVGKMDIYHSVQACLFALAPGVSRFAKALKNLS